MKSKRFGKWLFGSVVFRALDMQNKMMQEAQRNE